MTAQLTRAQKAKMNRDAREAQEAADKARALKEQKDHLEANLNSTAGKMLLAMAALSKYGNITCNVVLGENGPEVSIRDDDAFRHGDLFWFGNLTLLSDNSVFTEVYDYVEKRDAAIEAARQRRVLAQKTWDEMDPAAREALGLITRPV